MSLKYIMKKPVITEKSIVATGNQQYTFEVDMRASKGQVKEAIQQQYGVDVISVNTVKTAGKSRRTGRRRLPSVTSDTKKAIVQIKAGQKIEAFEVKG